MKYFPIVAALATVSLITATSAALADVGVSINVGQPGFYGQIDIGDFPQPQVIYREPMVIERRDDYGPPIYLRVPPGHIKHWRNHCREYDACGRRVYFVQDNWYNHEYVPRYQQRHQNWHQDDRREHDGGRNEDQHRRDNEKQHHGDDDRDHRNDNRDGHDNHDDRDNHDNHDNGRGH